MTAYLILLALAFLIAIAVLDATLWVALASWLNVWRSWADKRSNRLRGF